MKKNKKTYKPRLLALELTRRCRFNCRHCRADAERTAPQDELTTEQWKKILASVASYEKCVVIMTGGEPTERSDLIELVEYSRQVGLRAVMATCGYAIDDATLAKLTDAGVQALSFSLDGATAETHDA
ncbi:MAG: radical SAM protein, partial [Phycisphaerales bacterium]